MELPFSKLPKGFIGIAISFYLSFSLFYIFGFFRAIGNEAFALADASTITQLLFQISLSASFSIVLFIVISHYALTELVGRDKSVWTIFFGTNFSYLAPVAIFYCTAQMIGLLAPDVALWNLYAPILIIFAFYVSFLVGLPRRGNGTSATTRLFKIRKRNRRRFREIQIKNLIDFAKSNSAIIVFAVASWLGYSRAEYLLSIEYTIHVDGPEDDQKAHFLFNQSGGSIFYTDEGTLVRIPSARFSIEADITTGSNDN